MTGNSVRWGALLAGATFLATCAMWGAMVVSPGDRLDPARAPLCDEHVALRADTYCHEDVPATVADKGTSSVLHYASGGEVGDGSYHNETYHNIGWVTLIIPPATTPGPQVPIAEADWPAFNPQKGEHVTATVVRGSVVAVADARAKYVVFGASKATYPLMFLALFMLIVSLIAARVARDQYLQGWRASYARFSGAVLVPLTVISVIVFYSHRSITTVWLVAVVGGLAGLGFMAGTRVLEPSVIHHPPAWSEPPRQPQPQPQPVWAVRKVLTLADKQEIELWMGRFAQWFGEEPAKGEILTPRSALVRAYGPHPQKTEALWQAVSARMGTTKDAVPRTQFSGVDLHNAVDVTAAVARMVARARVVAAGDMAVADPALERIADLAAIYLGFGVICVNAGFGPLADTEFCYALAWLWSLRAEGAPQWALALDPTLRMAFELCAADFNRPTGQTGTGSRPQP